MALFIFHKLEAASDLFSPPGATGDWSVGTNWSLGTPPGPTDDATIDVNKTATVTTSNDTASTVTVGSGTAGSFAIVNITTGGTLTTGNNSGNSSQLGTAAGATGTINVTGPSAVWNNTNGTTGDIQIGVNAGGAGNLNITLGGSVLCSSASLGVNPGSTGTVTVDGLGSIWNNSGPLTIGNNGVASMTVQNQATAFASNVTISIADSGILILSNQGVLNTNFIVGQGGPSSTLTFTGGTLQAASSNANFVSGITAGQATFGAGGGFIDTQTFSVTIPQSFSGTGGLTQLGSGSLTLTGTNTFTGDITLSGTLAGTIGVGLPTTTTNVIDNGILIINQATNATYTANISGSGQLIKNLADNVTLAPASGSNSYSGGTQINAGTLTVTAATLGTGNTLNNASLIFNQSATGTYSGNITGSGNVIKSGTGTTILTGLNGYTGGTAVNAGTLQGNTSSLQGLITNNATLAFNQTSNGTFSGTLVGSGSLVKEGSANVNITDNSLAAFLGTTTINAGQLTIGGPLGGNVTINSGGTLSGSGTVVNVNNSGTIMPTGTIQLSHFVNNANGTYQAGTISPSGASNLIAASSTAMLNGGLLSVSVNNGIYIKGSTYTLLTANGGLMGTFSSVSLPSNIPMSLEYLPDSLVLTVLENSLNTAGLSGNALRVAEYITKNADFDPDFITVIDALNTLDTPQLSSALNQLHPAPYEAVALTVADAAHMVSTTFVNRLNCLQSCLKRDASEEPHHLEVWSAGFADFIHQSQTGGLRTFSTENQGVVIGFDHQIQPSMTVGLALGYSHTNLKWSHNTGIAHMDGYYMGLYTEKCNKHFYLNGSLLGYVNQHHAKRHIHFSSINRIAQSKQDYYGFNPHLGTGVFISPAFMDFVPFIDLDYYLVQQNPFLETGADSINLDVSSNHASLLRNEIGCYFRKCYIISPVWDTHVLIPSASISYVMHCILHGKKYVASFEGIDDQFTVFGTDHTFHQFKLGAGLSYLLKDSFKVDAWYDIEFGDKRQEQEVSLKLGYRF